MTEKVYTKLKSGDVLTCQKCGKKLDYFYEYARELTKATLVLRKGHYDYSDNDCLESEVEWYECPECGERLPSKLAREFLSH